jgi:uncharacterized protein YjbI with pentapeptide repeats
LFEKIPVLGLLWLEGDRFPSTSEGAAKSTDEIIVTLRQAHEKNRLLEPELQNLSEAKFIDADLSRLDLTGRGFSSCEISRCNVSKLRYPSADFVMLLLTRSHFIRPG